MRRRSCASGALWVLALGIVAGFGHLVYPALLAARTRRLPDPDAPSPLDWPPLTVVVPAYRERAVIRAKVDNLLANGYPGELEVLVVADDPETAAAARQTAARVLESGGRLGKAEAVNRGVAAARTAVVVLTDANNLLVPGALAALARWFADPAVGAVAGEKRVAGAEGESAFWRFESWLKRRESRTGTTIGLVGELAAFRREAFRPLPPDTAVDDLWLALDLLERRVRVVYEPDAVTLEPAAESASGEWERRTRIAAGVLDLLRRRWQLLLPGRADATLQLWGHRAVRLSLGPVAHAALVARALPRSGRSPLWSLFLAVHAFAAVALARQLRGARLSRVGGAAAQVLFLQAVALAGVARYLRGERLARWPKAERPAAGPEPPS